MFASPPSRFNRRGAGVGGAGYLGIALAMLASTPAAAINLQFDYRFDATGFFGTESTPTPARAALEFAGRAFSGFADSLASIQPGNGNSWTASLTNPRTGAQDSIFNLVIPHGTVTVFAATRDLAEARLAEAGPGLYQNPTGSAAFLSAVTNRGQGAAAIDFGPWGGFISFDTHQPSGELRPWEFALDSPPAAGAYDFYTVAVHELAHILGFGTSAAYWNDVSNGQFVGPAAQQLYQNPVPLASPTTQHFAYGVTSPPFLENQPKPSLGPSIALGERKLFTPLDYAVMADIGWSVPGELLRLPGDVDDDADVDGADFLTWQQGLGGLGGAPGDVNGDLIVDAYDGWVMRHYLGATAFSLSAAPGWVGVPEPPTNSLFALALFATASSRKRPRPPAASAGQSKSARTTRPGRP